MNEPNRNFFWIFFLILGIFWLQSVWFGSRTVQQIPYSQYESLVKQGDVQNLIVTENHIRGEFKQPQNGFKSFVTNRVEPELAKELSGAGVTYRREIENTFFRDLLSWVVPALIFVAVFLYFSRKFAEKGGMSGLMSVGKSGARLYAETGVKVSFGDVAGVEEAKAELYEVVQFLKSPQEFGRLGARMPKGILLVGPPGTGKTLLAKAVAGEAQVPFYSITGSEFVEMFVGVGAARVRDLFEQARKNAPCIIFIDELDALGKVRGVAGSFGGHDEKEQTLNQLLAELDGFDSRSGVVILAATNRPEVLDPALLRAGRFDRQVLVDRPDRTGREQILRVHLKKIKADEALNVEHLAHLTSGFTGADIANLINEAAMVATRRKAETVNEKDFVAAIERIVAGLEKKSRLLNEKEKAIVAHHEMGHAIMACLFPGVDKVQKISIIPRGLGALGYTMQRPTEDRYLMTRPELLDKICVLLGGRVAEELIFGEVSTGASDDLVRVTNIAEALVTRYGMSEVLGNIVFEQPTGNFLEVPGAGYRSRTYSEKSATEIDQEIRQIVAACALRTRESLAANLSILKKGAAQLLEKETLSEPEIELLMRDLVVKNAAPQRERDLSV
ncbi:ATP-dependent zinc metalloprotease FtsH [Bdellovibrio bacteriovorus]|uniref:ATP-dependent zinc metalloprotease FtsH 2 n=1 Tax=Bdellovibrio bacteriovorus (strain ATCC 15356 / DSM 50701 / NCIMB 9529 / HD100) TaxID=264462 RepID=FTSH2_BDEBA|nr:ATP-dependent zinc metalloprotease FtsH [Bdellovibrio bacteriovorus]Q6MJV1.1 RecName: Full=ATP-dependent zinc metalloprotease FtsH 2 [Bdellovibrio bacteriovorus HD100]AHZ85159.1 cell division protein FtsH [Bdellovibrio bacteriovorus]BEV69049.1 ATP-dependent zinc metalloprotease FtsH 4 [Bdellovibrio bacteriovorus]CAE80458.1 membrane bound zinc metallopeptidase [Bdellovibrio bacteriovorus HD100]